MCAGFLRQYWCVGVEQAKAMSQILANANDFTNMRYEKTKKIVLHAVQLCCSLAMQFQKGTVLCMEHMVLALPAHFERSEMQLSSQAFRFYH